MIALRFVDDMLCYYSYKDGNDDETRQHVRSINSGTMIMWKKTSFGEMVVVRR